MVHSPPSFARHDLRDGDVDATDRVAERLGGLLDLREGNLDDDKEFIRDGGLGWGGRKRRSGVGGWGTGNGA